MDMDEIEKVLRKSKRSDRKRLLRALEALRSGRIEDMNIKKLRNSRLYRIRIGDFRILFSIDRAQKLIVTESVQRRNGRTYK